MVDPSLATVEAATLTQGVAFLHGQAGDLPKRRGGEARARAAAAKHVLQSDPLATATEYPPLQLPKGVFGHEGGAAAGPQPEVLDRPSGSLLAVRRTVDDCALGTVELGPQSAAALQAVDHLRSILEEIYRSPFALKGNAPRLSRSQPRASRPGASGGISPERPTSAAISISTPDRPAWHEQPAPSPDGGVPQKAGQGTAVSRPQPGVLRRQPLPGGLQAGMPDLGVEGRSTRRAMARGGMPPPAVTSTRSRPGPASRTSMSASGSPLLGRQTRSDSDGSF